MDAMGGDNAPEAIIQGIALFVRHCSGYNLHFKLFGNRSKILPCVEKVMGSRLKDHSKLPGIRYEIIDAPSVILADDRPSAVLRKKRDSSMYMAVLSVKNKESDCMVSAGNTGALMAVSKFVLGMLDDISRPAIISILPKISGEVAMLDLGANLECNSEILMQFAIIGSAFSKAVMKVENPTVALLNIGSEDNKGKDNIKEAFTNLSKNIDMVNFVGYIEPDRLVKSSIDVVVTDGFVGNILLKSMEGTFYLLKDALKTAFCSSIWTRICAFFLRPTLSRKMKRLDPKLRNGAMIVGLDGIIVKSHGKADDKSFANALKVALHAVDNDINSHIIYSSDRVL